jgi:hypothetical protein
MKHLFIIAVFVLSAVASCKPGKTKTEEAGPAKTEEAAASNDKGPKPIVDVPSLVGKNIDEVKKLVGVAPFEVKESEISFYLPDGGPTQGPFYFNVKYFSGDEKPDELHLRLNPDLRDSFNVKSPLEFAKFAGFDLTGITTPPLNSRGSGPWVVKAGGAPAELFISGGGFSDSVYIDMSISIRY